MRSLFFKCLLVIGTLFLSGNAPGQEGRTYYFDAVTGNDSIAENTLETPWKTLDKLNGIHLVPGDSVLLRSGQSWQGQIRLQDSGTEDQPITLGRYGNGARPRIDGNGATGAVLTLLNVSHWEITQLEITNQADSEASRLGVLISASGGLHGNIHLDSLFIHDISGNYSFQMSGKNTGGIGIIGGIDSRFDQLLIEHCEIRDIVRVGIFTNGNTGIRGDRPITNLVIRDNTLTRCAGDGMIIRYAYRPLIENNLAVDNHNGPEDLVEYGVAIWVRSTDEAVIQHNRVFGTKGSMDAQAFDADLDAYRTLVQYNYSRDNEGGFMLVYGSSQDAIVRYNISQNDGLKGGHLLDFPIWVTPRGSGIFHNNAFFIGEAIDAVLVDEALPSAKLYNNIVVNLGGGPLAVYSDGQTAEFSHNCLMGYDPGDTSVDLHAVDGDPNQADPGTGGSEFSSLDGYMLTPGSPCLKAGIPLSQMNGDYWRTGEVADFWGNPVGQGSPDVGVHQFTSATLAEPDAATATGRISWEVVPVPFGNHFQLCVTAKEPLELYLNLYDICGRYLDTLYSGKTGTGSRILDVDVPGPGGNPLKPGMYLLKLFSGDGTVHETRRVLCNGN